MEIYVSQSREQKPTFMDTDLLWINRSEEEFATECPYRTQTRSR